MIGNSKKKALKVENKIISDVCESIIGAMYLDRGLKTTNDFIIAKEQEEIAKLQIDQQENPDQVEETG